MIMNIWETGRVHRWHTLGLPVQQSVADHCWGVAVIVHKIFGGHQNVLLAALYHDAAEAKFGDLPRPARQQLGQGFVEAEDAEARRLGMPELSEREQQILDIADLAESVLWAKRNQWAHPKLVEIYASNLQKLTDLCDAYDYGLFDFVSQELEL